MDCTSSLNREEEEHWGRENLGETKT